MYATHLGLEAYIIVPKGAGRGKKLLLRSLGAHVVETETREDASKRAVEMSKSCYYVAHSYSPIFIEGMKSIAEELKDYGSWSFIVPTSSGTLLLGLYRGFRELGLRPKIYAVQAAEAASLKDRVKVLAEIGGSSSKLADALVLKDPPRVDAMAEAVNSSGGGVIIVGDDSIRSSLRELLSMGLIVEPSSAAAWAAFKALKYDLGIDEDFVVPLTGSGLKYYEVLAELAGGGKRE
jgi:threonine synthase